MNKTKQQQTHFGFKQVDSNTKKSLVHNLFSNIANKYDAMNDMMTFGAHRLWKDTFCNNITNLNAKILDVAGGSGDIALRIAKTGRLQNKKPKITIYDINQQMLDQALNKVVDNNFIQNINYVCGDAENLPFESNTFDYYTISFGIRNVSNIQSTLSEAFRVLKPHGKFLCLEFSKLNVKYLNPFYHFYTFNIIPKIGKIVTNNESAYRYLAESISMFPDQNTFKIMIQDAGFSKVQYQNLSLGIAAIHKAYKL